MPVSMYQASIPLFRQLLQALSDVLDKGAAFAAAKGIDPLVLTGARLAPDMFPLSRQVQIACDMARMAGSRLSGQVPENWPDEERSFEELKERIARTLAFLDSIPAGQIDGSEDREITVPTRTDALKFRGQRYLFGWVIPNLTFHCTTAYAILRHNGVEIGKRDFLGAF
ncbi:conserved protein of unknown function [Rhodovastum atsumiense]|uniref:DUF1993 domain-containing protein n=1 Tax=Rhodovastum atsumiense TaxID=504468 RepID=A0A5M6IRB8_9PROT|nr:DUF1993 domain-containing protein [Rhodovastum atsumiense]KAA5610459.1 DUF1993 domain-containing protein [Rhodovastum atsumiense]CAH2600443.1 conserved protein of unknown function [Rhodovastum atsumiense]